MNFWINISLILKKIKENEIKGTDLFIILPQPEFAGLISKDKGKVIPYKVKP